MSLVEFGDFIATVSAYNQGETFLRDRVERLYPMYHRRTIQRWLSVAEELFLIERMGAGPSMRYRRL